MLVFHASADRRISPRDGHLDHSPMNERGESTLRPVARRWLSALSLGILAVYALFYAIFLSQSGPKDGDQFLVFHSLHYWNDSMFGMAKQWTPLMCSSLSMEADAQDARQCLHAAVRQRLCPLRRVECCVTIFFPFR